MKNEKRLLVLRNQFVVLAKFRKAGSHRKPNKALRGKQYWEL